MKIGVFGSSFNPVTNAHLWVANTAIRVSKLDKVLFLPSSCYRLDKNIKISDFHRLKMLKLAIKNNNLFEIDIREMQAIKEMQYSYFTMQSLKQMYAEDELFFIIGADLLCQLPNWVNSSCFLQKTQFIVIGRENISMSQIIKENLLLKQYESNFKLVYKKIKLEISSSYIRYEFSRLGDPRYLIPEEVYRYIKKNHLYII